MSHNALEIDGLDELMQDLQQLPEELTAEASTIITSAANEASREITDRYPTRAGALKDKMRVTHFKNDRFSAGAIVKNSSPHAALFEFGSQARHTDLGAGRGSMPPGHVFIPIMIRRRHQMYERLKAMLVRHGLEVSGDA